MFSYDFFSLVIYFIIKTCLTFLYPNLSLIYQTWHSSMFFSVPNMISHNAGEASLTGGDYFPGAPALTFPTGSSCVELNLPVF